MDAYPAENNSLRQTKMVLAGFKGVLSTKKLKTSQLKPAKSSKAA